MEPLDVDVAMGYSPDAPASVDSVALAVVEDSSVGDGASEVGENQFVVGDVLVAEFDGKLVSSAEEVRRRRDFF